MTRDVVIDALARLMAKQEGRHIDEPGSWHPDDWVAEPDHYSKKRTKYGEDYRKKAERFYDRWMLVEQMTSGRE